MKKHSERFENAVTKLYNAFHSGDLNANNCQMCAVGNICDNNGDWAYLIRGEYFGKGVLTKNVDCFNEGKKVTDKTGYSPIEIVTIERLFVSNNISDGGIFKGNKESQFKGLCAVIEYLCELEGIPNIMDYQKLFETEHESLESVFA